MYLNQVLWKTLHLSLFVKLQTHIFIFIYIHICVTTLLAKKEDNKTNKTNVDRTFVFHLAEIGMIWTRDCSPTKSDTTLSRHSMQGQVGSLSSETTV